MRALWAVLATMAVFQSCVSDGGPEKRQYVILRVPQGKAQYYFASVKDIQSGDSVWVRKIKYGGNIDDGLPERFAEYLHKVVTGNFGALTWTGTERATDTFEITGELRDTVLTANPRRDGIDSLLVDGASIGDFAPMKKGSSWTYVDSTIFCDGYPDVVCTVRSVDTVTYSIADAFISNDTSFYRIASTSAKERPYGNPETCYEDGNQISNHFSILVTPCVPLFYVHKAEYLGTTASRFFRAKALGKDVLVYSLKGSVYDGEFFDYDSVYLAKDVGALRYVRSHYGIPHQTTMTKALLIDAELK